MMVQNNSMNRMHYRCGRVSSNERGWWVPHSLLSCRASSGNEVSTQDQWVPFDHGDGSNQVESGQIASRMIETQRGEVAEYSNQRRWTEQDCCQYCHGTGLTVCQYCKGTSRVNRLKDDVIIKRGAWPIWCTRCIRCSGKTVCGFCLGTGKKREPIGFRVGP